MSETTYSSPKFLVPTLISGPGVRPGGQAGVGEWGRGQSNAAQQRAGSAVRVEMCSKFFLSGRVRACSGWDGSLERSFSPFARVGRGYAG